MITPINKEGLKVFLLKYNPLAEKYYHLQNESERYQKQKSEKENLLNWYNSSSIGSFKADLSSMAGKKADKQKILETVNQDNRNLSSEISRLQKDLRTNLNPLNWLSKSQWKLRKEIKKLEKKLSRGKIQLKILQQKNEELEKKTQEIEQQMHKYNSCDPEKIYSLIAEDLQQIVQIKGKMESVYPEKSRIDKILEPVFRQIKKMENDIETLERRFREAESFDDQLNTADNSYERKMIHDRCQEQLGDSQPRKILTRIRKQIEGLQRNIEKLNDRAKDSGKNATRVVENLIIDGNNLCYNRKEFLGLLPLQILITELLKKYKVVIIFDNSILKLTSLNRDLLSAEFPSTSEVHVVPSAHNADQTILELAASCEKTFVLSKDRFKDFFDQKAVTGKRILRPQFVNGKILIHDLNVNINYEEVV